MASPPYFQAEDKAPPVASGAEIAAGREVKADRAVRSDDGFAIVLVLPLVVYLGVVNIARRPTKKPRHLAAAMLASCVPGSAGQFRRCSVVSARPPDSGSRPSCIAWVDGQA
jgi:hypothetical protein